MGLFEKIFGAKKQPSVGIQGNEFKTLTAYAPVFTSSSGAAYECELIRSAIHARASHISRLQVEFGGYGSKRVSHLAFAPNDYQTWSQFMYRLSTVLDNDNTAFICPIMRTDGHTEQLHVVMPRRARMTEGANGKPCIEFEFRDGKGACAPLESVGVMTKFQYRRDFYGEDNSALRSTMDLINIQNQGIEEGVKSSATYRFMAQASNFVKPEDLVKERKRFSDENLAGEGGGLLLFPNTYSNIQQVKSSPFVVDAEQMRLINQNVYNYFGVNDDILQNKAVGDSWSAFYEGAVEPFAIQFSEVLTKMMRVNDGRDIFAMATANRLQYMANKDKLEVSAQMADRGIMNRDEIREIWNLPPLPNGEGQRYTMRGEYYFTDKEESENAD